MKNILIAGALPNANGMHIGHISSLLPGDILARYFRAKGHQVYYVSGSDCFGTPITIQARETGKSPGELSEYYHNEATEIFKKLGFSFDLFTKTTSAEHIDFVRSFHRQLYAGGYVYEKEAEQLFCPNCSKALADRLVKGTCPNCGADSNAEQCGSCGEISEAAALIEPECLQCGETPVLRKEKHLYLAVSKLKHELEGFLSAHPEWRKNAIAFTKRYIEEGLRDRAITRDLDWGIEIPKSGYEKKRIYIWAENVLAYLSASRTLCEKRGESFEELWGENAFHYYVHGKDNIPFHTIILPALLLANGGNYRLPDSIVSSEHITLNGRKISSSKGHVIWAKDISAQYNPDSIRYFFIANGAEKRDTDFSWREFAERNNGELLGAYGNFVNRSLAFVKKYYNGVVPEGIFDESLRLQTTKLFETVGSEIETGQFKQALTQLLDFSRVANKYFDNEQPWKTRTENPENAKNTLFTCVQLAANLAVLLHPFLPFSSEKVFDWLNVGADWRIQGVPAGHLLPEIAILFERMNVPQ